MTNLHTTLNDVFSIEAPKQRTDAPGADITGGFLGDAVSVELKDAKVDPKAMMSAVSGSMSTLLNISFAGILSGAYAKAAILRDYREKSRRAPTESFAVAMATHTIKSQHKPSLALLVNDKPVTSLPVEVVLQLKFDGVVLKIQNGRIMEIRPGTCTASGKITCKDYVLAEEKAKPLTLPGVLSLGDGIEIATGPEGRSASSAE